MSPNGYLLPFQRELISQVALAVKEIVAGSNSVGILLLGGTGTGKTWAVDELEKHYTPTSIEGQIITPMCRINVRTKGDAISILAEGLRSLGRPTRGPGGMKLIHLEPNFEMALRAHRTRIVTLEEAHNALLSGSPDFRGQTERLIKNLWNSVPSNSAASWGQPDVERGDWRLVLVLSGTHKLSRVIMDDGELRSRFQIIIEAPTLSFDPPALFKEFREIFAVGLARMGFVVDAQQDLGELAVRALLACDGHLRVLEQILRRAATLSHGTSMTSSLTGCLAEGFTSVLGSSRLSGNPFRYSAEELSERYAEAKRLSPTAKVSRTRPKTGSK